MSVFWLTYPIRAVDIKKNELILFFSYPAEVQPRQCLYLTTRSCNSSVTYLGISSNFQAAQFVGKTIIKLESQANDTSTQTFDYGIKLPPNTPIHTHTYELTFSDASVIQLSTCTILNNLFDGGGLSHRYAYEKKEEIIIIVGPPNINIDDSYSQILPKCFVSNMILFRNVFNNDGSINDNIIKLAAGQSANLQKRVVVTDSLFISIKSYHMFMNALLQAGVLPDQIQVYMSESNPEYPQYVPGNYSPSVTYLPTKN